MKFKLKRYRIVYDNYAGYEAQVWRIWWPFWCMLGKVHTYSTLEAAESHINRNSNKLVKYVEVE
jgi:hypothetical protein